MACDFCKGKTKLKEGNTTMRIEDGLLYVESVAGDPWYNNSDEIEINHCPMCGEKLGGDV